MAQQQSEVIISLAVSIRFNFSSRLHLPESLDCVTVYQWNQCRAAESLYLSKRSQAPPKGRGCVHICLEMHTLTGAHTHAEIIIAKALYTFSSPTYILILYVYISGLTDIADQMPTRAGLRIAGL